MYLQPKLYIQYIVDIYLECGGRRCAELPCRTGVPAGGRGAGGPLQGAAGPPRPPSQGNQGGEDQM